MSQWAWLLERGPTWCLLGSGKACFPPGLGSRFLLHSCVSGRSSGPQAMVPSSHKQVVFQGTPSLHRSMSLRIKQLSKWENSLGIPWFVSKQFTNALMISPKRPKGWCEKGKNFSSHLPGRKQRTGVKAWQSMGTGPRGPEFPSGSSSLDTSIPGIASLWCLRAVFRYELNHQGKHEFSSYMRKSQNIETGRIWKVVYAWSSSDIEICIITATSYWIFTMCQMLHFVFPWV